MEFLHVTATLGEGPSWDAKRGMLYWVDIVEHKVNIYNPKTNEHHSIDVGQMVGAVVPRESGGVVLATETGFYTLDLDTKKLTFISDPEDGIKENRFNDGKCDPAGRFLAGTMDHSEKTTSGSLYCLEKDHSVRKLFDGVAISNGMAWTADHKTMFYIDTPTQHVVGFDYDIDTGELSNKRVVVTIDESEGHPDGMTIDGEDMIWVAHWQGGRVSRWNPKTGEKIGEILLPASRVTACCFAGDKLEDLYITTARIHLTDEELAQQPQAGGLFRIRPGVKGSATYAFGG